MARIFTTQFQFNLEHYDAIVTVIPKDGMITYKVKVLDTDLHMLLPSGEFSYYRLGGTEPQNKYNTDLPSALIQSISMAIEEHLTSID